MLKYFDFDFDFALKKKHNIVLFEDEFGFTWQSNQPNKRFLFSARFNMAYRRYNHIHSLTHWFLRPRLKRS